MPSFVIHTVSTCHYSPLVAERTEGGKEMEIDKRERERTMEEKEMEREKREREDRGRERD